MFLLNFPNLRFLLHKKLFELYITILVKKYIAHGSLWFYTYFYWSAPHDLI